MTPAFMGLGPSFGQYLDRSRRVSAISAHGNDLHAAIVAFAVAARDHALETGQGQMHHAAVARVHRLEGDDLALFDRLLAESLGHAGQRVVATALLTLGVDGHVPAIQPPAVPHPLRDALPG